MRVIHTITKYKHDDCAIKSEQFFVTSLLPEILVHWYTWPAVTTSNDLEGPSSSSQTAVTTGQSFSRDQNNEDDMTYCICNGRGYSGLL